MIKPTPQSMEKSYCEFNKEAKLQLNIADESLKKERTRLFGTVFVENGNVIVSAKENTGREMVYLDKQARLTDEKYCCRLTKNSEEKIEIELEYSGKKSFWYAMNLIEKMIAAGKFVIGEITDYPLFEKRGFIEGFYGKTWQPEQRIDMLKLAAFNNMNTFYYAPKDDPYHRRLWNELYPQKELFNLKELVDACAGFCIDFYYCIAPGLSMRYSSEENFNTLVDKTKQLYDIGVRGFGLLLDDIPRELAYAEDVARYGDTIDAHIELVNRYYNVIYNLDKKNRLTVCPMQYHGKGTEYEIAKFGKGIVPEAELFWTGNEICSREITVPEAVRFIDSTNHRPLYWDNYPVNDAEMFNEMHLGPIMGRDEDLYRYSKGIIANCMEYFECTKIPLMTIADYLWNPAAYDKEESFINALNTIIGEENVESFLFFADHMKTSCLHDSNSVLMSDILGRANAMFIKDEAQEAIAMLKEYISNMETCAKLLAKDDLPIFNELRRWSDKFALCTEILSLGLEILLTGNKELLKKFAALSSKYEGDATILTGFCFREFEEFILAT